MPAHFNLCDGGTYNGYVTPNMQGLFLAGAGVVSANPAATGGMGIVASGTIAGDTSAGTGLGPSHTHVIPSVFDLTDNGVAGYYLTGQVTGGHTVTPRYGTLAFIMRTS